MVVCKVEFKFKVERIENRKYPKIGENKIEFKNGFQVLWNNENNRIYGV